MYPLKSKKYKTGIALGGGGARGYAHLGVLQALKEKGIEGDIFAGTSSGAIAGAFMASGMDPLEVFKIMKRNSIFDFAKMTIPSLGLMRLGHLGKYLGAHIQYENLEDLPKPLIIAVSDLFEGKVCYLKEGPLIPLVQASASIPVLFSPVELNKTLYADGGIFDNLPYMAIQDQCRYVYAIHISPVRPVNHLKNLAQIATRTFELSVNGHIEETRGKKLTIIAPKGVENYDILDAKHADRLFEIGYEHTIKMNLD
ncbi:MAG: patatin [Bacteroidetes bacterium]|nr:patatin [Bacteroidota bacterium]